MLASMKYRVVHLRLHYSTVERLQRVQDEIAASTYSEVVRHLLQMWERRPPEAATGVVGASGVSTHQLGTQAAHGPPGPHHAPATTSLQIPSHDEHTS